MAGAPAVDCDWLRVDCLLLMGEQGRIRVNLINY